MRYLAGATTLRLDRDRCTGCGRCLEVCPHAVFTLDTGRAAVANGDRCMECGACSNNCEPGALAVRSGVGCAAALLAATLERGHGEPQCRCC